MYIEKIRLTTVRQSEKKSFNHTSKVIGDRVSHLDVGVARRRGGTGSREQARWENGYGCRDRVQLGEPGACVCGYGYA